MHRAVIAKVEAELENIAAIRNMTMIGPMRSQLLLLRDRLSKAVEDDGMRVLAALSDLAEVILKSPFPPMCDELILLGGEGKEWAQHYNEWRSRLAQSLENIPF